VGTMAVVWVGLGLGYTTEPAVVSKTCGDTEDDGETCPTPLAAPGVSGEVEKVNKEGSGSANEFESAVLVS
jgi:hypothetical protein